MHSSPTPAPVHGDEDELYRRHHRGLLRSVSRVVRGPDELIEDACQMAWMTLLRCQPERDHVFGWLRRVAINEAYRLSAIARREPGYDPTATSSLVADHHDDHLDRQLEAREALVVLSHLPERQRRDLALVTAGFSYKEIQARTAGRTATNVNKTLRKARARVRLERLRATHGRSSGSPKGAKSAPPPSS